MLEVSRLRSGMLSVPPEKTELSRLLQRVIGELAQQAAAVGSAISLHAPQPVDGWWDEFRIEQLVVNLLTNALRYGRGKPVEVRLSPTPQGAHIEVRDHDVGISAADQQRIFQQFERAGGGRLANALGPGLELGMGLGQFITRQLVEAHGGSIRVHSEPGRERCSASTCRMQPGAGSAGWTPDAVHRPSRLPPKTPCNLSHA